MAAKFESRDWMAALNQLKSEAGASAETPRSTSESDKREQFKVKVIEARVKLKLMRDRTDALKEALERYRARRESIRA
ncbi:hypothetical protein [Dokdonella soli]